MSITIMTTAIFPNSMQSLASLLISLQCAKPKNHNTERAKCTKENAILYFKKNKGITIENVEKMCDY